jgi:conjugal transfer pilus assembly protein TraD
VTDQTTFQGDGAHRGAGANKTAELRDLAPLLIGAVALFLLAVTWPLLAAGVMLTVVGRLLPERRRLHLYAALLLGAGCAVVVVHGVSHYVAHAPAWSAFTELHSHPWPWLANTAPLALVGGAWLAIGGELWVRAPVNRAPSPSWRGFAYALTIHPLLAGGRRFYARLRRSPHEERFRIGKAGLRPVVLRERDLLEHTAILGATGSGKTNTLRLIAGQAISAGWPVVVLDLKGDPELARELERAAGRAGAEFRLLTVDDHPKRAAWNPIAAGGVSSRADRLIIGRWSEEHYERTARDFARITLHLLDLIDGNPSTLPEVARYLHEPEPVLLKVNEALARQRATDCIDPQLAEERDRFATLLAARKKDRSIQSATAGLAARLREISESDLRPALAGDAKGGTIDLTRTLGGNRAVICFSLDFAADPTVTALTGSLALRDLQQALSARTAETPALLLLDEFSVLDSDEIRNLLARARSKCVGVVLSTQSLADLTAVDANLKTQTLSNTATKIIHRLGGDEEPEVIASLAGTRTVDELTNQIRRQPSLIGPRHVPTGTGSARRVDEYVLHPNRLRSLKRGHAAVILRADPQWLGFAKIDDADKGDPSRA